MSADLPIGWVWCDRPGLERVRVAFGDEAITLEGEAIFRLDEEPAGLHYTVRLDGQWRTLHARVGLRQAGRFETVDLSRVGTRWYVSGSPRSDLDGADDIDIMGSPITNTFPIRRLAWAEGDSRTLRMVYIGLPHLTVEAVAQRYTALDAVDADARRFDYESMATGFKTRLRVNAQGLVLSYPPYWQRLP